MHKMIVPPSFDTVCNFPSRITKFVVTVVLRYIYCCFVLELHVDINRGVTEFETHLSPYLSCIVISNYIIYLSGLWFQRSQLIRIYPLFLLNIIFCCGGYSIILINIPKTLVENYIGLRIDIEYSECPSINIPDFVFLTI